ncbi:hypothetical protein ACI8BE_002320 [Proteus mirabilis]|uniref:hypothetical protein n=1 Tax=Morganellaceae TaxID=1903414 RepID=UPI001EFD2DC8|nr:MULTISPECIES: hypothetical protein [Morganellaceae]MCG9537139.1 hypothetical protein [Providencia huaxiensis]
MKKTNIFIFLIFFSAISYAFVPAAVALLGQNAIRTGITRLIASRALPVAANDAVYLTLVNGTRAGLTKSITNLSIKPSYLKTASGLATFAFIAEQFDHPSVINGIEFTTGDIKSVISDDLNLPNYQFYVAVGSGGTRPYLFSNNLDSLANDAFLYDIEQGVISNTCDKNNCRFSNLRDLKITKDTPIYSVSAKYDYEFKNYNGDWVQSENSYLKILRDNPVYDGISKSDKIVNVESAKDMYVTAKQLSDAINSLMLETSLSPDYKGIPFSTEKTFTESEVKKALNTDSIPLVELLKGFEPYGDIKSIEELNKELNINVDKNPDPNKPDIDKEVDADIKYPDLEMPTAEQILNPYKSFFPELQNFKLTPRNAECPVWIVPFLGKDYQIDSHCPLIEQNRGVFESVFSLVWAFIALRKLLSA